MTHPPEHEPVTPGQPDHHTLRDAFATAALMGLISRPESTEMLIPANVERLAAVAWGIADAMIATRKQR